MGIHNFARDFQQVTLCPSRQYLTDDEWQSGLHDLCPVERPDIKNPGEIKPLDIVMCHLTKQITTAEAEALGFGKSFRNLHQLLAHFILHNFWAERRPGSPFPVPDGAFVYFRMLCGVQVRPFMAALDFNFFGLSCCHEQQLVLSEGDVLLYAQ